MLDRAEVVEEGKHARGIKLITANDPAVSPDGVFPAVYIVEAMAQTSGIASGKKTGSRLAGLKNIEFRGTVLTGDVLELESLFERNFSGLYFFTCTASVTGKTVAEGGVILYFDETA
jgi:3-hydroxymyristoyl/3-hydroxydecanoyl-(acyl carrier protein) dehydratase